MPSSSPRATYKEHTLLLFSKVYIYYCTVHIWNDMRWIDGCINRCSSSCRGAMFFLLVNEYDWFVVGIIAIHEITYDKSVQYGKIHAFDRRESTEWGGCNETCSRYIVPLGVCLCESCLLCTQTTLQNVQNIEFTVVLSLLNLCLCFAHHIFDYWLSSRATLSLCRVSTIDAACTNSKND